MRYTPKTVTVEAVYFDSFTTALEFLQIGELVALSHDGLHLLVEGGTIFAPLGECYLVRWGHGIDMMDKSEFEAVYEEAQ